MLFSKLCRTGFLLLSIACTALPACGSSDDVATPVSLSTLAEKDALARAPASIEVEGQTLTLAPSATLNSMPSGPTSGKTGIYAQAEIENGALVNGLKLQTLYVIQGEEVWKTGFTETHTPVTAQGLRSLARGGPVWGGTVDIAVRLETKQGVFVYLRKNGLTIVQVE